MCSDEELSDNTSNNTSSSTLSSGTIKIGQLYENKGDLKMKLHVYVIKKIFEFKVKKSEKYVWYITCIDDNYSWKLRARKLDKSKVFE